MGYKENVKNRRYFGKVINKIRDKFYMFVLKHGEDYEKFCAVRHFKGRIKGNKKILELISKIIGDKTICRDSKKYIESVLRNEPINILRIHTFKDEEYEKRLNESKFKKAIKGRIIALFLAIEHTKYSSIKDTYEELLDLYKYEVELSNAKIMFILKKNDNYFNRNCIYINIRKDNIQINLNLYKEELIKYIHVKFKDGSEYITAMPLPYHKDILEIVKELTNKRDVVSISGGYMVYEKGKIIVGGSSHDFGSADHERIVKLLKEKHVDAELE